jgi:hypothetical protein
LVVLQSPPPRHPAVVQGGPQIPLVSHTSPLGQVPPALHVATHCPVAVSQP